MSLVRSSLPIRSCSRWRGAFIDRFGLRAGFALFGLAWSAANMMHALAIGWVSLAIYRGILGLFESAAIPSGIKAVAEWFRRENARWRSAGSTRARRSAH